MITGSTTMMVRPTYRVGTQERSSDPGGARILTGLLFLVLLALLPSTSWGEAVRVEISVEGNQARAGDEISISVKATGPIDSVDPPRADGLELKSAGQSTSMSIINNTLSSTMSLHYRTTATNPGIYNIGPALAYHDGRIVGRSKTITVKVLPALQLAPIAPDAQDLSKYEGKGIFVIARAPRNEFVVGEPFRFDMDLYIRRGVPVGGAEISKQPTYDGFKRIDLLEDKTDTRRYKRSVKIGRTTYDAHPLDRSLLIPLSTGARVLGQGEIKARISRGFRVQYKKVAAQPLKLNIVEPPSKGKPASFFPGAVGAFKLTGSVEPKLLKKGERVLIDLQISGEGNLDALAAPQVQIPQGMRAEPIPGRDCPEQEISQKGFKGRCVFQTVLFPQKAGIIEVGPARLGYFNPGTRTYEEALLGPWKIEIEGDKAKEASAVVADTRPDPIDIQSLPLEPPFIDRRPKPDLEQRLPKPPPPWLAYGLPLIGLFMLRRLTNFRHKLQSDEQRQVRRKVASARTILRKLPVKDLNKLSTGIAEAFRTALLAYYNIDPRGFALDRLGRELERIGVPESVHQELLAVLEAAEAARFSGQGDAADLKKRARNVLERL